MTHRPSTLHYLRRLLAGSLLLLLAACTTMDRGQSPELERNAAWVVLPFANHTETPLAGSRAEAIAEALLRTNGMKSVKRYPGAAGLRVRARPARHCSAAASETPHPARSSSRQVPAPSGATGPRR